VYFRQSCATAAAKHSVTGWVRNVPDGRVEAVFEGPATAVEAMVDWCRTGPRYSKVQSVEVRSEPVKGHTTFAVRA
jgi:acylphosphatase